MLFVERAAFGYDKEAELVREMLADPTAKPLVSLLSSEDGGVVGHILFTTVRLEKAKDTVSAAILAPYPIPEKNADAWMVQAPRPGIIGTVTGNVVCCKALDKPEHWRE